MPPSISAPVIWSVSSTAQNGTVHIAVDAEDEESGLAHVGLLYNLGGSQWRTVPMSLDPDTQLWTYSIDLPPGTGVRYVVQAVDTAGNVTLDINKGQYLSQEPETIYLPIVVYNASQQ